MAKWNIYCGQCYKRPSGMTKFYVLPSIEYYRDTMFDVGGGCHFDIDFAWLFWYITISRYWGGVYENKNHSKRKTQK